MSQYFTNMRTIPYAFGDEFNKKGGAELTLEAFQDITSYVEIIDEVRENAPFYSKYYILDNDRPDQVSQKIYGTPIYHWTFFMMNDGLRRQGWPLSPNQLDKKIKRDFPHRYIRCVDDLTGIFLEGQRCEASQSGGQGLILRRHLDLGTIIVDSKEDFIPKEKVSHTAYSGITKSITVNSTGYEYNAPHHFEDVDGNIVDIDPALADPAIYTKVTNYDHYVRENNKLRELKVIRPDAIQNIVGLYFEALKS